MTAEKDELIRWMAQTVHQGYHMDIPGTFRECPRSVYKAATDSLAATTERDKEYEHYRYMGGELARGQWEHVMKLHMQYIESDRISPYEAELML